MINSNDYRKLLYFYFQDYIFNLPPYEKKKFISPGFFLKCFSLFKTISVALKSRVTLQFRDSAPLRVSNQNWVFIFSKNNFDATDFLKEVGFIFVSERNRTFLNSDNVVILPYKIRLRSYLKFPVILWALFKTNGKRALQIWDLVFNSIGWLEAFDDILLKYRPKSIVFSNDHSFVPRALMIAAKKRSIPTIYIQHATVTESFPPLEFDLNLLEGIDSFNKYKNKGVVGEVRFIGMPKFDRFCFLRKKVNSSIIKTIGFAFNPVDSIPRIAFVLGHLTAEFPELKIVVRKHSKDKRDFRAMLSKIGGIITCSDALQENSFEFSVGCDVLIAGDSAIHLDACLVNVQTYYFNFSEGSNIRDLYGYLANGFIKELTNIDDLIFLVRNGLDNLNVFIKAKPYHYFVGTEMEARTTEIAINEINKFLVSRK